MRILLLLISILSVGSSLLSQCDTIQRYNQKIFTEYDLENYKYGENNNYKGELEELTVDVYTPKGDTEVDRPMILFCFGGAFVSGTRKSLEIIYLAEAFVKRGYVCASIDYRLDDRDNMMQNGEAPAVIRGVQDAKAAIRYLKSKQNEIGFDTNRIVIGGTSAGGIIALSIGYSSYTEFPQVVKNVIDTMGGYDGTTNSLIHNSDVIGVFNFSGAIFDTNHIQANDLPVYLNHSIGDQTVPFYSGLLLNGSSSTAMDGSGSIFARINNIGGNVTIDSFTGGNHPSFLSFNFSAMLATLETNLTEFFCETTYKSTSNTSTVIYSEKENLSFFINFRNELVFIGTVDNPDIQISDMSGRVWTKQLINNSVSIFNFNKGIYFIKIDEKNYKIRF